MFGLSSVVLRWWHSWCHFCNYMFDIEDVAFQMFNAALLSLSVGAIIIFVYKITHMKAQDESPAFEAYRDKVLASESMAETIVDAVDVVVDFKKNSISAAGYVRIRQDRESAKALLKQLDQQEAENLLQNMTNHYVLNDALNAVENYSTCTDIENKMDDNTITEHKLSGIVSETCGEIMEIQQLPKNSKRATRTKHSSIRPPTQLQLPKYSKGHSVTFALPNLESEAVN